MSETHANQPSAPRPASHAPARPTGWVGWIIFAGVTMIVLGAFSIIEGLVAVFQHNTFYANVSGSALLVLHTNWAAWGWVHFGIGCAIVLIGFGVMTGATVARVLGITVAVISAIVNLAFLATYPVWGIIIIALDVLVIYALAVHGREMKYV
jgi:hypothetical protein